MTRLIVGTLLYLALAAVGLLLLLVNPHRGRLP